MDNQVTLQGWGAQATADIDNALAAYSASQQQIATGRRINTPGDDPAGVVFVLSTQGALAANSSQFQRNGLIHGQLQTTDDALNSLETIFTRARDLAVAAASDGVPRSSYLTEAQSLLQSAVQAANQTYNGAYLFAGSKTTPTSLGGASAPFTLSGTTVTYNGDTQSLTRAVGNGQQVTVNVSGNNLQNMFNVLGSFVTNLTNNDGTSIRNSLNAFDSALQNILSARAQVGVQTNLADRVSSQLQTEDTTLSQALSQTRDVDMAAAATRFNQAGIAYQAAIQSSAHIFQKSLLDYMG